MIEFYTKAFIRAAAEQMGWIFFFAGFLFIFADITEMIRDNLAPHDTAVPAVMERLPDTYRIVGMRAGCMEDLSHQILLGNDSLEMTAKSSHTHAFCN